MQRVETASPRALIREPLELAGRGFPTDGHDRSATQKLMISQANAVLGHYESLLNHIKPHANKDPQGPLQALVEVTTRLNQAALTEMTQATNGQSLADLRDLKTAAESGVRFIEAHLHHKLEPGHPAKAKIANCADALMNAISALTSEAESSASLTSGPNSDDGTSSLASSECSVATATGSQFAKNTQAELVFDPAALDKPGVTRRDSERSSASSNSENSEALFEQLRGFVRNAKPFFNAPSDRMTGALGERTTDLHSVLFTKATPESIIMRKMAARSAVIFAAHDAVSKPHVTDRQRQHVMHVARQLVGSIDALLTQPALRLGMKGQQAQQAAPGWLKGLVS